MAGKEAKLHASRHLTCMMASPRRLLRMDHVPEHLRIKVLYEDQAMIVIDKPSNLRSVPGHANPPPAADARRDATDGEDEHRLTAQESWVEAIRSFHDEDFHDIAGMWLRNLAVTPSLVSVPRKCSLFRRYCEQNQQRLSKEALTQIQCDGDDQQPKLKQRVEGIELDVIARKMHERIRKRQVPLMNLPEATDHEDSAFGQLILLGYSSKETDLEDDSVGLQELYVVHRLDCEVSVE